MLPSSHHSPPQPKRATSSCASPKLQTKHFTTATNSMHLNHNHRKPNHCNRTLLHNVNKKCINATQASGVRTAAYPSMRSGNVEMHKANTAQAVNLFILARFRCNRERLKKRRTKFRTQNIRLTMEIEKIAFRVGATRP